MPHPRLLAALLLLGVGSASAADPVPGGGLPDLVGARTLGLPAEIGAAPGNEGIFVNPAGLAARKRYAVEGSFFSARRGSETVDQLAGASVVDSSTGSTAAGIAYERAMKGADTGNVFHLALAFPIAERFYAGATGKLLQLSGAEKAKAVTADAGIFWQVTEYVSIGGVGYNLVSIHHPGLAPRAVGAGIAIGTDRLFQLTADWKGELERRDGQSGTKNRYAIGAELLLASTVPLRGGFIVDEVLDTRWWTAGIGLVSGNGVAIDLGYRQSTTDPTARELGASLRIFLFN